MCCLESSPVISPQLPSVSCCEAAPDSLESTSWKTRDHFNHRHERMKQCCLGGPGSASLKFSTDRDDDGRRVKRLTVATEFPRLLFFVAIFIPLHTLKPRAVYVFQGPSWYKCCDVTRWKVTIGEKKVKSWDLWWSLRPCEALILDLASLNGT